MTWAMEEKSYSQRRACGLIGLDPKTYRYASRRSDDGELREGLKALVFAGISGNAQERAAASDEYPDRCKQIDCRMSACWLSQERTLAECRVGSRESRG